MTPSVAFPSAHHARAAAVAAPAKPRLGFLGVGWIGLQRMRSILASCVAEAAAVVDVHTEAAVLASRETSDTVPVLAFDELLEEAAAGRLDGVVIATPSALHAAQSIAFLERGVAVFCQKPLGRTATETRDVVDAARTADRLLGVDLSYRHIEGMQLIRGLVRRGELGDVYAVDLVFHNAYGPDKPWFYDVTLGGGGCVIDLGVHLVDLALWTLAFPPVTGVDAHLFADGRLVARPPRKVEDHAVATLELATGAVVRLACSWRLHAGRDAIISATFSGTRGGAALFNVNGSFYDFSAECFHGTSREPLAVPADDWGGRAAIAWARQLARDPGFDPAAHEPVRVAEALDAIYGR